MLRVVKPGGTLLASAAMLLPLIPEGGDYWRLTPEGWRLVLEAEWPGCEIAVQGHGNCLSAAAAMYGLAQEELKAAELDVYDPRYPVLITIRCRKPLTSFTDEDCAGCRLVLPRQHRRHRNLRRRARASTAGSGHDVLIAAPEPGVPGAEDVRVRRPASSSATRCRNSPPATRRRATSSVRGSEHFHRWLAEARADVVHVHTFVTGLGLPEIFAAKRAGSRVIATTHSSSLGFLCQRGTLMWQGRTICDGLVDACDAPSASWNIAARVPRRACPRGRAGLACEPSHGRCRDRLGPRWR